MSSSTIRLVDTLDNTWHQNTNPNLAGEPQILYCEAPDTYDPMATDADGDSLVFSFVNLMNGTGVCSSSDTAGAVNYVTPYTGANPLGTSSFSMNANTGIVNFTPNIIQRSQVLYNIREYRHDTLMGTSQREMSVTVTSACSPTCMDTLPVRLEEVVTTEELLIYPNPTNHLLTISSVGNYLKDATFELTDIAGRIITNYRLAGNKNEISLDHVPSGIYLCRIVSASGKVYNSKITVTR